jgi:hypothetical protein
MIVLPTLRLFFHWSYCGKLYSPVDGNGQIPFSYGDLCAFYVFGDIRGAPEFCNAAIDLLFRKFATGWAYPGTCLHYAYDNTTANSELRSVFVDLAVDAYTFANLRQHETGHPKDFLIDVVLRTRESKTWPGNCDNRQMFVTKKAAEMCNYHDHRCPH